MLAKKIIENLKNENYRVEYREYCDCGFYWHLNAGELDCDIQSTDGDCWFDNALVMDDLALDIGNDGFIACYDAYFGLNVTINTSREVEQEIVKAIKDSDAYTQLIANIDSPDANNDLHDKRKQAALVNWLEKNTHFNLYVYYPRDFANEYVCVLLAMPYYYYQKDSLQVPINWYPKNAEKWAEMYLQKDTDGTQYDIDFRLVNQIYEIDYCWYDRHADMTVSHETERYFFVDLQDAENFLDTREPGGINCYELNKLTVDYDGMIAETDYIAVKCGPEVVR